MHAADRTGDNPFSCTKKRINNKMQAIALKTDKICNKI